MIIQSLLDNDLYSFTQQQLILHQFPDTHVKYEFKCRNNIDLKFLVEQINKEVDELCQLRFKEDELEYLHTLRYLTKDYIDYLKNFILNRKHINVFIKDNQLAIEIEGSWLDTVMFEIPVLAIVQEVYSRSFPEEIFERAIEEGKLNLERKIQTLDRVLMNITFTDFGTRRRFTRDWHTEVVTKLFEDKRLLETFLGSSNIMLSKLIGFPPTGTQSHQIFCVSQNLPGVDLIDSQKFMLGAWLKEFKGKLGTALSDTISLDVFLRDFEYSYAEAYHGIRIDSGDNFLAGDKIIDHYKKLDIDPMTKFLIFSDGLNFEKIIKIAEYFKDRINVSFGIGTDLTNSVGLEPAQIVIKVTECNGKPVAKLSDSPGKTMCKDQEFVNYLKKVFNI